MVFSGLELLSLSSSKVGVAELADAHDSKFGF
jgi:hypothetical protein